MINKKIVLDQFTLHPAEMVSALLGRNGFYFVLLLLCSIVVKVNYIPEGYIVSVGDIPFRLNIEKNLLKQIFYQWSNISGGGQQGTPDITQTFHLIFIYCLNYAGVLENNIQNIIFFLFLFISAFSMHQAINLLFKKVDQRLNSLISFAYAFNHTTMLMALAGGIYSTYYYIYMIFPLLLAIIYLGIADKGKFHYLILVSVLLLVFIGSFGNPAFLIGFILVISGFVLIRAALEKMVYVLVLQRLIFFFAFLLLILSIYTLPYFYSILSGASNAAINSFNLESTVAWAKWTKVDFTYIFRLDFIPMDVFPNNFSYESSLVRMASIVFSYAALAALIISTLTTRKVAIRSTLSFFIILISIIFYSSFMRMHDEMLFAFFSLPFAFALRSPEKLTIFFNTFLFLAIASNMNWLNIHNRIKIVIAILLIASVVEPLPFWFGKIHKNVSINTVWDKKYDTMIKIPDSYQQIANYLNNYDTGSYKILSMPYTGTIGAGWSLRKDWKFIGYDTTTQYFNNPVYLPLEGDVHFNFAIKMDANPIDYQLDDFILEMQKYGVKYLIVDQNVGNKYHLSNFYKIFQHTESYFELIGVFDRLKLYKIQEKYYVPIVQTGEVN